MGATGFRLGTVTNGLLLLVTYAVVAILGFLYSRSNLPTVLQDELIYSSNSRLLDANDRGFSNHIYFELYSLTNICGPNFYDCARGFNAAFSVAGAFIVFLLASRYVSRPWAILSGLVVVGGPLSIYSSVFMPESMFFAFLYLGILFLLQDFEGRGLSFTRWFWITVVIFGFASLIKPHILLFLPGLVLPYFFQGGLTVRQRVARFGSRLLSIPLVVAVHLIFAAIFTRMDGPFLFETYDTGVVSAANDLLGSAASREYLLEVFAIESLQLFFLFFVSAVLFLALIVRSGHIGHFEVWVLVSFAVNVLVIGLFTAYVTLNGDNHLPRSLLRYLEWYYPLFALAGFRTVARPAGSRLSKYGSFLVVVVAIAVISIPGLVPQRVILADSATIFGLFREELMPFWYISALIFGSLLLLLDSETARRLVPVLAAVVMITTTASSHLYQKNLNSSPVPTDLAAQFVYRDSYLSTVDNVLVLGTDKQLVLAAIFQLDRPDAKYRLSDQVGQLLVDDLSPNTLVIEGLGLSIASKELPDLNPGSARVTIFDGEFDVIRTFP